MVPIDTETMLEAYGHRRSRMIRRIAVIKSIQRRSEPRERRFWIRKILEDHHKGDFNTDIHDYYNWDGKYFVDYF